MDDYELIAAVAGGDDAALRELFWRHAPWLATRLRSALPAADVEDVVQETFLAVWRGAARYRPPGPVGLADSVCSDGSADSVCPDDLADSASPASAADSAGGWLWGIARRQAALLLRRRGPATLALPALIATDDPSHGDPAEAAITRADLDQAVAALGPADTPEREVWRLLYLEDRPVAEVAKLTGVPAGTVKSRAHRVRHLLRAALRGGPGSDSPGPAQRTADGSPGPARESRSPTREPPGPAALQRAPGDRPPGPALLQGAPGDRPPGPAALQRAPGDRPPGPSQASRAQAAATRPAERMAEGGAI